jgi:hypothetical protein
VASKHEPTRAWLRRALAKRLGLVVAGIALVTAGGSLLEETGYPEKENVLTTLSGIVGIAGFILVGLGLVAVVALGVMRWHLSRNEWRTYECRYREVRIPYTRRRMPVVVLVGDDGTRVPLLISSAEWRWRALEACDGKTVWFAGDPERRGVLAFPGGTRLLLASRPRLTRRQQRLVRQAPTP